MMRAWGEVEDDAMVSLAQKCFAGCLGSEHAGLTFDAEVAIVRMASPARNPHPGDGLDPLLGPRIFRALRRLSGWHRQASCKVRE